MKRIISISFLVHVAVSMLIPEETEMLEGFAPASHPEISPEDDYFEARSLSESALYNSIRNKRNANYEVLESKGLASHFRPNSVNTFKTIFANIDLKPNQLVEENAIQKFHLKKRLNKTDEESTQFEHVERRRRRSIENEKNIDEKSTKEKNDLNQTNENLPTALKQIMKTSNGFFPAARSASAATLVSKWTRTPFEYSKIQHEQDSMAMDSSSSTSVNEGMKARTPRVNFVTQQKKSLDQNDDSKASATKPEFYKSPPLIHNSKEPSTPTSSERYPDRTLSRPSAYPEFAFRDRDMNRYDSRYTDDLMYPPASQLYDPIPEYRRYYEPYDPYMSRTPYADTYYDFPHSRYDVPDFRDYPPMYNNDIDDRYYTPSDMAPPPPPSSSTASRRRTIYYANLPEVVRSPPTVDLRYRSYDRYDPYHDYYNYGPLVMSSYRKPITERHAVPEQAPIRRDYRTSRPLKVADEEVRIATKEKRFDRGGKLDDDKSSMHMYSYHRPSEYGSSLYY